MSRREAYGAYHFNVQIPGGGSAQFRSVSGLKSESEVVSLREGGCNDFEHKLVGGNKYSNIVLKQGFANQTFCQLRQKVIKGQVSRFNGSIIQLGPGGKPVAKWNFVEGWICKWEGPDFDATKNEISIETIEIAHHGLEPA
jgi:phage tail-like protein